MKIYRAYITYNNGDYNEWEEVYRAESKWYTSREEAEKHFEELSALADWLRYKNKNNGNFSAEDPDIEEGEILGTFQPMENIEIIGESENFEASKFHYISDMPSLEIESVEFRSSCSNPIGNWVYSVRIGDTTFNLVFREYSDELEYYINPTSDDEFNKDSKYWLYAPEIKEKILNVIKEKVAEPLLPIFEETRHAWDERDAVDDGNERYSSLWWTCRLKELKLTIKGITSIGASVSEYAYRSLLGRRKRLLEFMEDSEDGERGKEEIEYLNTLIYCD